MGNRSNKVNKINKKKIKSNISKKMGGDTESGESYVVTIAIITHGCIINLNPTNDYNIRYYSATGDKLGTCDGNIVGRSINHDELREHFRQDEPKHEPKQDNTIHTVDAIPDYYYQTPYDKYIGEQPNRGFIINFMDNVISPLVIGDVPVGVWLISVHKKYTQNTIFKVKPSTYDFPIEDKTNNIDKNTLINLLKVEGLKYFNKKYNNINLDDKLNNDDVTIEDGRIKVIRLSYLLDLVKDIIGNNCGLNVYDYSCSSGCEGHTSSDNKEKILAKLIKTRDDGVEAGKLPFFPISKTGGKRRNKRKPRSTKNKGKSRKTRKNKFTKYLKGGRVKCEIPLEIKQFINQNEYLNEHLINNNDDIEDVERELMIQGQIDEINDSLDLDELDNHIPYSIEIDNVIDKLKTFIENNKNKFFKISVTLFVMYYLMMCQPQQPKIGGVKRKTRKNKFKKNKKYI
jgi:hypothetical protein